MPRSALLLALLCASSAAAADVSTTPYQTLYGVLAPAVKIRSHDRLAVIERIGSKSPDVAPASIAIVIHARRGDLTVPVGADGSVDFPIEDALRDENPSVGTNQPKGSLGLVVVPGLRLPSGLDLGWADVLAGLAEADAFFAEAGGAGAPKTRGIVVEFAAGEPASVTLVGRIERPLMADGDGHVVIARDLVESAQTRLRLSRRPAAISFFMAAAPNP